MNFKKRVNGSWVDTPNYIHNTSTDTITTLPTVIYPTGTTATVGLKGNTVQNGTPTHQNPIMPQGTGERTENLFDNSTAVLGKYIDNNGNEQCSSATSPTQRLNHSDYFSVSPNSTYTFSSVKDINVRQTAAFVWYTSSRTFISRTTAVKPMGETNYELTATAPENAAYAIINYTTANNEVMLNTGSTALPYEPYGYKIPILNGSVTTNVYLGEVETTRKIKKYEITGQESDLRIQATITATNAIQFPTTLSDYKRNNFICSHMPLIDSSINPNTHGFAGQFITLCFEKSMGLDTLEKVRTYLQQQYAAGTPVTVWYVLSEPTTGIVNEPLRKIGDYADEVSGITIPTIAGKDTFDIQTTLKPSSVSLNYTGWHDASVKEKSRNLFDYSTATYGKYINAAGEEVSSSGTGEQSLNHSDFITITAETVYTFKCEKSTIDSAESNAFCWFDSSKQLISRNLFSIGAVSPYILGTATAPTNATYLIMNYRGLHGDTAMLNTGSTALPYEPYWK